LSDLSFIHGLFDVTAGASQSLMRGIRPSSQHETWELRSFLFGFALLEKAPAAITPFMALSILSAAVLAQPPVAEIEEVVGFVHGERTRV
jgi:hypothetical protein